MQWHWTQLEQLLKGTSTSDNSTSAGRIVKIPPALRKLSDIMAPHWEGLAQSKELASLRLHCPLPQPIALPSFSLPRAWPQDKQIMWHGFCVLPVGISQNTNQLPMWEVGMEVE